MRPSGLLSHCITNTLNPAPPLLPTKHPRVFLSSGAHCPSLDLSHLLYFLVDSRSPGDLSDYPVSHDDARRLSRPKCPQRYATTKSSLPTLTTPGTAQITRTRVNTRPNTLRWPVKRGESASPTATPPMVRPEPMDADRALVTRVRRDPARLPAAAPKPSWSL